MDFYLHEVGYSYELRLFFSIAPSNAKTSTGVSAQGLGALQNLIDGQRKKLKASMEYRAKASQYFNIDIETCTKSNGLLGVERSASGPLHPPATAAATNALSSGARY